MGRDHVLGFEPLPQKGSGFPVWGVRQVARVGCARWHNLYSMAEECGLVKLGVWAKAWVFTCCKVLGTSEELLPDKQNLR